MKFGQSIIRKIIKIIATRCQILRLKCIQILFQLGICPRPCWGGGSQRFPRCLGERKGKEKICKVRKIGRGRRNEGKKRAVGGEGLFHWIWGIDAPG